MDVEHGKTWIKIDGLQLNSSQLDLGLAGTAAKIADVAVTLEAAPAQAERIAELERQVDWYQRALADRDEYMGLSEETSKLGGKR